MEISKFQDQWIKSNALHADSTGKARNNVIWYSTADSTGKGKITLSAINGRQQS